MKKFNFKIGAGVNLGILKLEAEINTDQPITNNIDKKDKKFKKDYNKIKKYTLCFYSEVTNCVLEYATIKASLKDIEERVYNQELVQKAACYGLRSPSIEKIFDKEQIIGEVQESNGFDGIEVSDFDLSYPW